MRHPERPNASNDDLEKIVRLTDKDVRDAARLFRLLADAGSRLPAAFGAADRAVRAAPVEAEELLARAKLVLSSRRARSLHFNPAIFGEPAWEILLVLYITDLSGGRQTLGKLTDWIETPATSVLRWVGYLEKEKFLERQPHPNDRRINFLKLLPKGREAMNAYLGAVPG
jgi:hypothetical protein